MKKFTLFLIGTAVATMPIRAQAIKAAFGAAEAMTPYYEQGWDSQSEFDAWSYSATGTSTWKLGNASQPFSNIDSGSRSSMILNYSTNQNETATSPEIDILPNSQLEFYCYASGIYLYFGAWKFYAIVDGTSTLLIDQFNWAQEKGYDGPSWEKFTVDLSAYADKKVKFSFVYKGDYGEDEAIDGFKIKQADTGDEAKINIKEGESVHFLDLSEGDVKTWAWTFEGGEPATSTEQNPVVVYEKAGVYNVSLTVGDGTTTTSVTRTAFVTVEGEAPIAAIEIPEGAYLSPWVMMFVPVNKPLTFTDKSSGNPTQWHWTFQGTDIATSDDRNPTVIYTKEGSYGIKLEVANDNGSNVFETINTAIQAGGEQEIWNIEPEENSSLSLIEMGWYGNYAGTNWLGMSEFAEHFDAPPADASISKVNIYFGKTTAKSTSADITVKIMAADADGMPGKVLGTATVKAGDLVYDPANVVATEFRFDTPVQVKAGEAFFAAVGPFPNENGDDIAILLCRRGEGGKTTAYQFVLDEGDDYQYLDTGKWYRNDDDPISMAISPVLKYEKEGSVEVIEPASEVLSRTYYNLAGIASPKPFSGVNIVVSRHADGSTSATKIIIP